jgi:hypothetical protein
VKWQEVADIAFLDASGISYNVKDIKPINIYSNSINVNIDNNVFIDELISRQSVYGEGAENLLQDVVEANIINIVESEFDMTKVKSLMIPKIEA